MNYLRLHTLSRLFPVLLVAGLLFSVLFGQGVHMHFPSHAHEHGTQEHIHVHAHDGDHAARSSPADGEKDHRHDVRFSELTGTISSQGHQGPLAPTATSWSFLPVDRLSGHFSQQVPVRYNLPPPDAWPVHAYLGTSRALRAPPVS